ncbi:DUF5752 family protein [Elusimicrobiota bacterium]
MGLEAKEPFKFSCRLTLTIMTGHTAKNLEELLERLRTLPDEVIYHHSYRYLFNYQHIVPQPPNDFVAWVTTVLQDEELGEKLLAIDTARFNSIGHLRIALVKAVDKHIKAGGFARQAPPGRELHFMQAVRFSLPTPYVANNLEEFVECLKKVSASSLYLHIFEAKIRPPLGINDFSHWFEFGLGEKKLADEVSTLDPYSQTMETLRALIVKLAEKRIKELKHA